MVARDLPAMCAQHVGCLRAVVLSGSLYATMHIVREPSLLPVSLVFQYLARPHDPPLPQPVAPKQLRAADDLATIAWGALQGMVQVHDLGFAYGCAPNGNGPAVGFRRQQHCVQGVLLDFSCSTRLAHAHRGQAFALQADRDVAAALLKRCQSQLALASCCALALERVTAALVELHRARDLRQAASVLQDVQASCDRLARQRAADVERRRAGERARAMEAERGAQQRAAAQRARERVQEGADLMWQELNLSRQHTHRGTRTLIEGLARANTVHSQQSAATGPARLAVIMAGHKVLQHGQEGMVFAARACDRDP